jgi:murein DD-endopeptidase MepM/ murein hydrolase activator NlpD
MASIYESQGQQVALTGPSTAPSFRAEQAYDQSDMMLRQSERDLNAFSQFSSTLSGLIQDAAKKKAENDKNLGIAEMLNGDISPNEELVQTHKKQSQFLEAANDADYQVINGVKQENPGLAESLYKKSPAVTGWRAYGRAIGAAQRAAGMAEATFTEYLQSDTPITITLGNGTQKTFTPKTASTNEELAAVWNVGMQKYINDTGVGGINPVILAEHLTPVISRLRPRLLGQRMQEIIVTRTANEKEDLNTDAVLSAASMAKDPVATQNTLLRINKRLIELNDGNRAKGNEETHEAMSNAIRITASKDLQQAEALFANYRTSLVNPEKPELGTWGDRYEMTNITEFLKQTTAAGKAANEAASEETADNIFKLFLSNPARNYKSSIDALSEELKKNPSQAILNAIDKIKQRGPNFDPQREEALITTVRSKAEAEALKAIGALSQEGFDRASVRFTDDKAAEDMLPSKAAVEQSVRGVIRTSLKDSIGRTEEGFAQNSQLTVSAITGVAMASVKADIASGKIKDPLQASKALNEYIAALTPEFVEIKKTGGVSSAVYHAAPRTNRLKGAVSSMRASNGQSGLNLIGQALSRIPKTTSAASSFLLDAERIELNMDLIGNGGKPTADVELFARTSGVSVPELLRRQAKEQKIPFDANRLKQGSNNYNENIKVDRRLGELLANPRISASQRNQFKIELQRKRVQQQQQQPPATSQNLSSFKGQVSSVVYESPSGQPGLDLFFENKQFPAVLNGIVKDVRYESGYGNYVVVESIDPETGESVDVLYAHLASRTPLRIGQQVTAGQLVGTQGGTGNVRSADGTIASIDFLAPAPRGSGSMKPYRNYDKLRRRIARELGR